MCGPTLSCCHCPAALLRATAVAPQTAEWRVAAPVGGVVRQHFAIDIVKFHKAGPLEGRIVTQRIGILWPPSPDAPARSQRCEARPSCT